MFEDAIGYPWRGERSATRVLIGGLLWLFGFLILPLCLSNGYLIRAIRQVGAGDTETAPGFEDWGGLFVDGLVSLVIAVVYMLASTTVFIMTLAVVFSLASVGGGSGGEMTAAGVALLLLVGMVAVLVGLAVLYLLPAAWAAYAVTGKFSATFSPSTLRSIGGNWQYLTGVLLAVVIGFFARLLACMLILTIVGIVLYPFIVSYGNVASAYAIGASVAETPLVSEPPEQESRAGEAAV